MMELTIKVTLVCTALTLGGCSDSDSAGTEQPPEVAPATASEPVLTLSEDAVEYIALVEAEAWATVDPDLPTGTGKKRVHLLHNEKIEARFYRLETPVSAAMLVDASGINERDCTEYPVALPEDPWKIFTTLPLDEMQPVDAGDVLTLSSPEGSWTELVRHSGDEADQVEQGSPYVSHTVTARPYQPAEVVLHQIELHVPGRELPPLEPIRLPTRWPEVGASHAARDTYDCLSCVGDLIFVQSYNAFWSEMLGDRYGDSQKVVAFSNKYLPYDRDDPFAKGPGAAICRGDDIQPLQFELSAAEKIDGSFGHFWLGQVGTTTERQGNVLVLVSYVANQGPYPDPRQYNRVRD